MAQLRIEIGLIAKPDLIQWVPGLPKIRLRKIIAAIWANSPRMNSARLADISVVDGLVKNRMDMNRGEA
ncbi:hypothetical protein [uncultured Tateyamaria sp.]|uniref:hypothetical protein n=1 Tax=uncultured Tateyamaria sp. TaxID=455651 RepID=UPI0026145E20|nr:hypothetical protein [uncultured Tateyamaria sp.]